MPAAPRARWKCPLGFLAIGALALGLTGCDALQSEDPAATQGDGSDIPEVDEEGKSTLPVYMVGLSGNYPREADGTEIGCQDLLVEMTTVPVETDDVLDESMTFLVDDIQHEHGNLHPYTNSVMLSQDTLDYEGSEVSGDTATVKFSGEITPQDQCESYRIRAQLEATVEAAAGVDNAEVLIDGEDLDTVLGLEPFERGTEISTDSDGNF